jgi:hypothetical protein
MELGILQAQPWLSRDNIKEYANGAFQNENFWKYLKNTSLYYIYSPKSVNLLPYSFI